MGSLPAPRLRYSRSIALIYVAGVLTGRPAALNAYQRQGALAAKSAKPKLLGLPLSGRHVQLVNWPILTDSVEKRDCCDAEILVIQSV